MGGGRRKDDLWELHTIPGKEYAHGHGQRQWSCRHCKKLLGGTLKRLKAHLGHVPSQAIQFCGGVSESLRAEMSALFLRDYGAAPARRPKRRSVVLAADAQERHSDQGDNFTAVVNADCDPTAETGPPGVDRLYPAFEPGHQEKDCSSQEERFRAADEAIRRFIIETGLPFEIVESPLWMEMVAAIARAGPGYSFDHME